jgi:hypothetical protein
MIHNTIGKGLDHSMIHNGQELDYSIIQGLDNSIVYIIGQQLDHSRIRNGQELDYSIVEQRASPFP